MAYKRRGAVGAEAGIAATQDLIPDHSLPKEEKVKVILPPVIPDHAVVPEVGVTHLPGSQIMVLTKAPNPGLMKHQRTTNTPVRNTGIHAAGVLPGSAHLRTLANTKRDITITGIQDMSGHGLMREWAIAMNEIIRGMAGIGGEPDVKTELQACFLK